MRMAYEAIVHGWRAAWRYDQHLAGDRTKLPEQKLVQSARYARDRANEIRGKVAEALEEAAAERARLQAKLTEALPYRPIDPEIRAYAQRLSTEERQRFLAEAELADQEGACGGAGLPERATPGGACSAEERLSRRDGAG